MLLSEGTIGSIYQVLEVGGKEKNKKFLFTLGLYEGEEIALISKLAGNYIINIRDSRYAIDKNMAKSITVKEL